MTYKHYMVIVLQFFLSTYSHIVDVPDTDVSRAAWQDRGSVNLFSILPSFNSNSIINKIMCYIMPVSA